MIRDGIERGEFGPNVNPESLAAALVGAWDALFLQAWFDPSFDPLKISQNFFSEFPYGTCICLQMGAVGIG